MKFLRYWITVAVVIVLLFPSVSAVSAANVHGLTSIAPVKAAAPHSFLIMDTGRRLVDDNCVAVFRLNGVDTIIPLHSHKLYFMAMGWLPAGMEVGDYHVSVRIPDGTEFQVGMFKILAS